MPGREMLGSEMPGSEKPGSEMPFGVKCLGVKCLKLESFLTATHPTAPCHYPLKAEQQPFNQKSGSPHTPATDQDLGPDANFECFKLHQPGIQGALAICAPACAPPKLSYSFLHSRSWRLR
eukprot:1161601-Pelagomonas_calceolata.AAC.7